jgi:hypothetical protein
MCPHMHSGQCCPWHVWIVRASYYYLIGVHYQQ